MLGDSFTLNSLLRQNLIVPSKSLLPPNATICTLGYVKNRFDSSLLSFLLPFAKFASFSRVSRGDARTRERASIGNGERSDERARCKEEQGVRIYRKLEKGNEGSRHSTWRGEMRTNVKKTIIEKKGRRREGRWQDNALQTRKRRRGKCEGGKRTKGKEWRGGRR